MGMQPKVLLLTSQGKVDWTIEYEYHWDDTCMVSVCARFKRYL